jgi:hypothetical protein
MLSFKVLPQKPVPSTSNCPASKRAMVSTPTIDFQAAQFL